jgi:hypothetical protein
MTDVTTNKNSNSVGGCPDIKVPLISCCRSTIFPLILDLRIGQSLGLVYDRWSYRVLVLSTSKLAATRVLRELCLWNDVQTAILLSRKSHMKASKVCGKLSGNIRKVPHMKA